jgi:hypothetical protein
MDSNFRIGPVEHGLPPQEVGIFHVRKGILDLRLTAIGQDNLLIAPVLLVSEQDPFPQLLFLNSGEGRGVGAVGEFQVAAFFGSPPRAGFWKCAGLIKSAAPA